jgi:uncharacterized protein YqjF (DUF2071 family)
MKYYFFIKMDYLEFLPYYEGKIRAVVVTATTGEKVQFPASHLRKYLSSTGIHGYFCMEVKNNKFLSLKKLAV